MSQWGIKGRTWSSFDISQPHTVQSIFFFFFLIFFQRLFIFGTEKDRAWTGEGQIERETQNRKQSPGSEPSAQSPTQGSNSQTTRSWPGWSRTLNRLRHPGAPLCSFLNQVGFLLSCRSPIYIFDTNPLSDVWFADVLSYSVGCLFALLIVSSFWCKKKKKLSFHEFTWSIFHLLPLLLVS